MCWSELLVCVLGQVQVKVERTPPDAESIQHAFDLSTALRIPPVTSETYLLCICSKCSRQPSIAPPRAPWSRRPSCTEASPSTFLPRCWSGCGASEHFSSFGQHNKEGGTAHPSWGARQLCCDSCWRILLVEEQVWQQEQREHRWSWQCRSSHWSIRGELLYHQAAV